MNEKEKEKYEKQLWERIERILNKILDKESDIKTYLNNTNIDVDKKTKNTIVKITDHLEQVESSEKREAKLVKNKEPKIYDKIKEAILKEDMLSEILKRLTKDEENQLKEDLRKLEGLEKNIEHLVKQIDKEVANENNK